MKYFTFPLLSSLDDLIPGSLQWKSLKILPGLDLITFAYCLCGKCYLNNTGAPWLDDIVHTDRKVDITYETLKAHLVDAFPDYELCGVKGGFDKDHKHWTGVFPMEAYRAYCEKLGEKFPFDDERIDEYDEMLLLETGDVKEPQSEPKSIPETVKELDLNSELKGDPKSIPYNILENIAFLISQNQELGDVLSGAIELYGLDENDRTKENFKKILDPKAKAHKWGLSPNPKYSLSPNQVNVLYGAVFKSSDKRRGNPKIRQGKNVKKSK